MYPKSAQRLFWLSAALLLFVGCDRSAENSPAAPATKKSETNPKSPTYFQTRSQNESQFIVETIASDLAEQLFFARHKKLPERGQFSVSVVEKPGPSTGTPIYLLQAQFSDQSKLELPLEVNGPIWSPDVYRGLVAALAKELSFVPSTNNEQSSDTELLSALTDGTAKTIEIENQKLSKQLDGDFDNPLLHEKAALLLGAFTLREHSGDFFEIRSPLCRITSHLAMAQFLSGGKPAGISGQVGRIMLFSLMNNQTAAVEELRLIESDSPVVKQWRRVLEAYNTGDYRPLADAKKLSLIERMAWFRAFAQSVDVDIAWEKLSKEEKLIPDFARIANENSYSVGTGHQLLAVSLPSTLQEIAAVYQLSRGRTFDPKGVADALNAAPGRCLGSDGSTTNVSVIEWGQWAMSFQRQLCHVIQQNFAFLQYKWGVPDEAKKFVTHCDQMFGGLRLYPFVRRFNCTDVKSYHGAVDDGMKVTVATPHLTPAECWNYLCYRVTFAPLYQPNPNPHINEWHKHNPPPGTAYNPLPRFNHPSLVGRADAIARVRVLHQLAPYDRMISFNLIRMECGGKPTYEQAERTYKAVLPYATYAMSAVAETVRNRPDLYEELMSRASELDPARYFNLGDFCLEMRMEDKAATYFEKGNELCSDRVKSSSYASWLVGYYLKRSDTKKAKRVADAAGEVYSAAGLRAKAEFFEGTGDPVRAMEWYSKIKERYDDESAVVEFCVRYKAKTGDDRFSSELKKQSSRLFPKGIETTGLKDFVNPPTDGVLVAEENDLVRRGGLKRGDVIVAIYGVRVRNLKQYLCGRNFDSRPEMNLIVWQGGQYRELKASPPNHRFGANFTDFKGRL